MFRLIGNDGKEYGPVSADRLRQWVHEGRVGGATQVRREGDREWSALRSVPEFSDVFEAPPTLDAPRLRRDVPAVVRLLAFGFFITATVNFLLMLAGVLTVLRLASNTAYNPGPVYFVSWAVGAMGLPIRVASGIGLLRGREWARMLAVVFAAAMALYGGWGLAQTISAVARHGDLAALLQAPGFVLPHLWSAALIAFHAATVILLSRRSVRTAFAAVPRPV